jgi:hypothetical protein
MPLTTEQKADLFMRDGRVSILRYFQGIGGKKRKAQYDWLLTLADQAAPLCAMHLSKQAAAAELGVSYGDLREAFYLAALVEELGVDPRRANLVIGRVRKAREADGRRNTIACHLAQGRSVADIVLLTGISRAAVYRFARELNEPRDPLLM